MSTTWRNRTLTVECDDCGEEIDTGAFDFIDGIETAKEAGWIVLKVDGDWQHNCPECKS